MLFAGVLTSYYRLCKLSQCLLVVFLKVRFWFSGQIISNFCLYYVKKCIVHFNVLMNIRLVEVSVEYVISVYVK